MNDKFADTHLKFKQNAKYKDSYEKRCKDNPHSCDRTNHCLHPDCIDSAAERLGEYLRRTEEQFAEILNERGSL